MATHRGTWKQRERQAAALFGARRQVLSGSAGRDDRSRSDSTHERLFLETKLRASHAAVALYDDTKVLARKEGKVPVVILAQKGRPGVVLVIAPEDLQAVAYEYAVAREKEIAREQMIAQQLLQDGESGEATP